MKKFIMPLLAATLLFTACGPQETTAELEKPIYIAENVFLAGGEHTEEKRSEYISSVSAENMLSENILDELKTAGIELAVIKAEENTDSTLLITLQLKNDKGYILNLPITAMLDFETYGDGFQSVKLYWGSLNLQDNELILTTINDIHIIDINKMTIKDTDFEIYGINNGDYYFGDTIKRSEEYITCCYAEMENKNRLLVFNSDGSFKQLIETEYNFFGRMSSTSFRIPYALDLDAKTELFFIDKEETLLAEKDEYGGSYVCNLQTGEFFYYDIKLDEAIANGGIALISMEKPHTGEDVGAVAALYNEKGQITDSFSAMVEFHYTFDEDYYMESNNLSLVIEETDDNVYTVYHPYVAQQVMLDFNTETAQTEYIYDLRWNYDVMETSADGEFSIVTGSYYGGGDAYYCANVLMENSTGKMKYIGETGGMYGGRNETGFFRNGDVYLYDYDAFDIYDRDMNNPDPVWQLTDYFPLGNNIDGVGYRYLMAARRDPQDKSVSIIYFDYPDVESGRDAYINYEKDDMKLKATYHFARISADGKTEFDYDTGVNALLAYNFIQVSIYPESNGNMHFYGWSQSHQYIWFEGSINTQTGVYTPIKEFKNPNM